jgi:predicted nucleic acid-binding protein
MRASNRPIRPHLVELPHLACEHHLTGYYAAFLELATGLELPFATSDQALIRTARTFRKIQHYSVC